MAHEIEKSKQELEKEKLLLEIKRLQKPNWIEILGGISSILTVFLAIASIIWAFSSGILKLEKTRNEIENKTLDYDNQKLTDKKDSLSVEIENLKNERLFLSDSNRIYKASNEILFNQKGELISINKNLLNDREEFKKEITQYQSSIKLEKLRQYNLAIQTKETEELYNLKQKTEIKNYGDYMELDKIIYSFLSKVIEKNMAKATELSEVFTIIYPTSISRNGKFGEHMNFYLTDLITLGNDLNSPTQVIFIELINDFLKNIIYVYDLKVENVTLYINVCKASLKNDELISLKNNDSKMDNIKIYTNDTNYYYKSLNNINECIMSSMYIKNKLIEKGFNEVNINIADNGFNGNTCDNKSINVFITVKNIFKDSYENLTAKDKLEIIKAFEKSKI